MKKKMITLAMVLFTFLSCSNKDYFDEGHVDLTPGYTIEEEDTYKVYTLNHPCLMHTNDDFQYVVGKIKTGAQPWGAAWEFLEQNQYRHCPQFCVNRKLQDSGFILESCFQI